MFLLEARLAHAVGCDLAEEHLISADPGGLADHPGKIRRNIEYPAAAAAHEVRVLPADIFVHSALFPQREPADEAQRRQMLQRTVNRGRTDAVQAG